jgi:hypothetical protein
VKKEYWPYLFLIFFSLPLFFINIHENHSWGDDFAQYIKEADNIAKGKPFYQSTYIFNHLNPEFGPPQYPPGFPLLLSPLVKVFGLKIKPMNYFMSFLLACLLFVLYAYYRKYTSSMVATCLAILCVYSGAVIEFKSIIASDISAWLFIALYFLVRQGERFSSVRIALLILIATIAILIRTQSAFILAAEGIYLFLFTVKKLGTYRSLNLKSIFGSVSFKAMFFTTVLFLFLNNIVFATPTDAISYYKNLTDYRSGEFWASINENISYLLVLILRAYHYYTDVHIFNILSEISVYLIFTFAIIGFIQIVKKRISVEDIYFSVVLVFFCYFSQHQGVRFIFSILPMYLLYAHRALRQILPPLLNIQAKPLAVALTVAFLSLGWKDFEIRSRPLSDHTSNTFFPEDLRAFDYIRNNVKDDEIVIFEKSRCLALFSGKRTITIAPQVSMEKNIAFFDSLSVKYLLTCTDFDYNNRFYDEYTRRRPPVNTRDIAPGYKLYQLK